MALPPGRTALVTLVALVALAGGCRKPAPARPRTGLEVLEAERFASLAGRRVAVVSNPTGVDRQFRDLATLVAEAPGVRLAAIFGPEHGLRGAREAGEPVEGGVDPHLGVPVYSLYGAARRPAPAMLEGIDVLLFDLQDVGARPYTYFSTLVELLEAAAQNDVELWVLDRPNPIGADRVEGPVLEPELRSFVGPHPIALRHGLTPGEFARLVNAERGIGARLRVVPMEGYARSWRPEPGDPGWIAPSPNIPDPTTALVYAGMVLVEGTNLSEGRGTTRPFRLVGAPWIDARELSGKLEAARLAGVRFRPAAFEPWASKYRGEICHGVEVHVLDPRAFEPVRAAVTLLVAVQELHPDRLEFRAKAFDRLAGTPSLREAILAGTPAARIAASWREGLEEYLRRRQEYLIYH